MEFIEALCELNFGVFRAGKKFTMRGRRTFQKLEEAQALLEDLNGYGSITTSGDGYMVVIYSKEAVKIFKNDEVRNGFLDVYPGLVMVLFNYVDADMGPDFDDWRKKAYEAYRKYQEEKHEARNSV